MVPAADGVANSAIDRRGRLPRSLVRFGLNRPGLTLSLWVAIAVLATPGVLLLEVETSTDSVLDTRSAEWARYQESQRLFGGDEVLTVLLPWDREFEPTGLAEVYRLTRRFEEIEGVRRVDSLASVPLIWVGADGTLHLEPGLQPNAFSAPDSLAAFRQRVQRDRIAPRALISQDEKAFAINLMLEQGAESQYSAILEELDQSLEGLEVWVSGVPIFRTQADARTRRELTVFVPLTLLSAGAILFFAFRAWVAVLVPLATSGLACWLVMGAMGASRVPITIATVLLPSVLLALGCAYVMHFLCAAWERQGRESLEPALSSVALPAALSGLTTAVGFLCIAAVRIDAIEAVGAFGALGVFVLLAITLTAVPALLTVLPLPEGRAPLLEWLQGSAVDAVEGFVRRRPRAILLGWLVAFGVVSIGLGRVDAETDVILWFPESDPVRVSYEEIRTRLSGISPMNVVVESGLGESVSSAASLAAIDRLARDLEELPEVGRAISIGDPLRQIHGGFVNDERRPLPEGDALVEQYLLLLEAKPYVRDLITADRSAANILMRVDDNGSNALLDVARSVEDLWAEYGPPGFSARTTGIMYEFARAEDAIVRGQILGLAIALCVIASILLMIFRSLRVAAIALVPNVLPIGMAFGFMGLLGVPLDAGTVIVGSLALGIAVDDTIHLTERFVRNRREGETPQAALGGALRWVLGPLVLTTLVVSIGFSVLGVSGFTLTRNLGLLTAGVMMLCLAADLVLLPVLLLRSGAISRSPKPT